MRDRDTYRSMDTEDLLLEARETGIDPEMAVVIAERLDVLYNQAWHYHTAHESMGGRYTFNNRSEYA